MYRDFAGAIREARAPQMSLERAMDDQRLMDQIYRHGRTQINTDGNRPAS
jgi:hypothetical protein